MLSIRKFQPADFQQVMMIEKEAFHDHNPLAYMRLYELNPDGFLVVEKDGIVIGFVVGILISKNTGRVLSIAVANEYRRSGVATQLMDEVLKLFTESGVKSIRLEVRRSNIGAQQFYQRLGFMVEGVVPQYYSNGEDAIVMVKKLGKRS
ncbi:MAG: ribosomal protein S18-alanine N-acetyltransferase [Methanocellales archaeon]|nr:ribosomal protein S18-alanine N-acetyltransferase [Methanocellales archaeon]